MVFQISWLFYIRRFLVETCCSGCCWLYVLTEVSASGFGVITGLGTDFWICLCWVDVLVFGFCFLPGVLESWMAVCCLFSWPTQLVGSQWTPDGVGGWDTGIWAQGWKAGVAGLCDPLRMGSERKERPLQAYWCRTGHETGGVVSQEQ